MEQDIGRWATTQQAVRVLQVDPRQDESGPGAYKCGIIGQV